MKKLLLILCMLAALACGALFTGALPVKAQESDVGKPDANVEDILQELDLEELQEYLDSLTQEQKDALGGDILEILRSLVTGDVSLDYDNAFSAIAGMVFDELSGLIPAFCAICSVSILCGILGRFKSSFSEKGTSKIIFFVGYCTVLVLILGSLSGVIQDCADTVSSMQRQMQAIFPILLTLIATSGGSGISASIGEARSPPRRSLSQRIARRDRGGDRLPARRNDLRAEHGGEHERRTQTQKFFRLLCFCHQVDAGDLPRGFHCFPVRAGDHFRHL